MIDLCKQNNINVVIKDLTLDEVLDADEVFFTGTASEITPVIWIDDKKINNGSIGEVTSSLKESYMDIVLAKSESHLNWLSFIK